jgi:hypothetical protein
MSSRFAALMAKFPRPAPTGAGPQASAAPPAALPAPLAPQPAPQPAPAAALNGGAASDSEEEECSLGALRARLCAAGAASPAPPAAAPAAPSASTSPVKRLGKARACATPSAPAAAAAAAAAQERSVAEVVKGEEAAEAEAEAEAEEEVEEEEEEEEELQSFSLKELKKSARKAPVTYGSGGGGRAEDALDYEDGWLVRDDVCEYEDGEGSLLFDEDEEGAWEEEEEEEEEEEDEDEEEEEEAAAEGQGGACEAENALPPPSSSGGCSGGAAATPARPPPLLAPSRFPGQGLPPPTPRAAAAATARPPPTPAPAPRPSFAGLRDGAPHPASGLVLVREELGLAPLAAAQRHAFRNRAHRDALTAALYAEYNARVFGGRLPPALPALPPGGASAAHDAFQRGLGVPLEWRGRLTRTAGLTFSSLHGSGGGGGAAHAARIALSVTVLDSPLKLAQTLLHEMCHVAVWALSHVQRPPHGAAFQSWARRATAAYPLRAVTVCHNYKVETRYNYACSACGVHVGRHSRSIAQGEACRACGVGAMALLPAGGGGGGGGGAAAAPATPRAQSKYMLFMAAERARVARELPGLGPKDTMAELARRWGVHKQGAGGLAEALGGLVIEVD